MSKSDKAAAPVQIGWGHETITPDQPVQLQGQMHERVSTHVNDPCTATALAVKVAPADGSAPEQAIIISCELVNFGREMLTELRNRVAAKATGFEAQKLMVCCTHPHTSPVITEGVYKEPDPGVMHPRDYKVFLLDQLEAAAVAAWNNRRPGSFSSAVGQAAIGFNRRVVYKDGSAKMYGSTNTPDFKEIEGASDPQVEILFTWDSDGKLTGVAVCPACPAQVVEGKCFVSADFWGVTRELLREKFGADLQVLGLTGAAGDQSPRDLVRRGRGEPNMRDLDGMHEMGRRLADAVIVAHSHHQSPRNEAPVFRHRHARLSLPMRLATQAEADEAQKMLDDLLAKDPNAMSTSGKDGRWSRRYAEAVERFKTQGDDPRFEAGVHFLRLGDIALATNPFELFLDYSFQIKAQSPAHQTFVVQLTNDRGTYLPTQKAVRGGSYSAMIYDNICGPAAGDELVEHTASALEDLWA